MDDHRRWPRSSPVTQSSIASNIEDGTLFPRLLLAEARGRALCRFVGHVLDMTRNARPLAGSPPPVTGEPEPNNALPRVHPNLAAIGRVVRLDEIFLSVNYLTNCGQPPHYSATHGRMGRPSGKRRLSPGQTNGGEAGLHDREKANGLRSTPR